MGIGKTLKELIKLRKTNVNELARNANVSPQTIYAIIKRDNKKADIEVLLKISKVLCVNADYFFNSDDEIGTVEIDSDKKMSAPTSTGERIKKLREEKGLTQEEVAKAINSTKQTVHKYETGIITNIPPDKIETMSKIFNCSPSYLMGWDDKTDIDIYQFDNIFPIKTQKLPLLGEIACGKPIFADEDMESFIEVDADVKADFCLRAKGDSMTGARILDGDIVFIRKQNMVDNGEIAAVIIDDEVTLKRVYYYRDSNKLILTPENPKYEPLVYLGEELDHINILGKAIAFQSSIM